ncbi:glutamate-rich protein 5-like [Polyodon spathula]|uniref:glutamate-rich protein 5-like n=1 Tax=Polyodon spathula TaxID=7913 RepID=UPI001B7E3CA5|nr:glutamate-rich protein 5-like [Polyodon spathula]
MGCSTSTQTQESNRPGVKPEENNGANTCAPLDVNSPIADESETIPDQSVLNQLKETDTRPEENLPTENTRSEQTAPLEDMLFDCTAANSAQAAAEETVEPATKVEEVIQDVSVANTLEDTAAVEPTLLETVAEEVAPRVTGTVAEESPHLPDTLTEVALGPSETEAEMTPSSPEAATELQETAESKHIEDETGEKVEGETQQEAASREPETKEGETGETLKAALTE